VRRAAAALLAVAVLPSLFIGPSWSQAAALGSGAPNVRPVACAGLPERPAELCFVVLVSRHSIRSPLPYTPPAELLTKRPAGWPRWPAPASVPGNLSAHGKDVAGALGAYYRAFYAGQALLPPPGQCAPGADVWVYADTSERTIQTAEGLVGGFFRRDPSACGGVPVHRGAASVDPIFKPVQAGTARPDLAQARREITVLAGAPISSLAERFREPLAMMQRVLDCCQPEACVSAGVPPPCGLADIPARLVTDEKTGAISLRGGLALAGGFADDFLLQYAEGMPPRDCATAAGAPCVGWGQITPASLQTMLELYVLKQTIDNRPPAVARASGSALMRQILRALRQKTAGAADAGILVPAAARFAAFVGHDTNLSNLGGLLRLSWKTSDYPVNTTPPASALIFELYRDRITGGFFVRTFFLTMTPRQFRNPTTVSPAGPPTRVPLVVAGCGGPDCPFARFAAVATAAINGR
jgi:4-phytase / acid phosphatase